MSVIYSYILVFIDHLIKIYHYEPIVILEVREAAQIFYRTMFRLYSLSEIIVFDQGSQFISEF